MKKHLVLLAIICSSIISFANDPAIQQIIHLLDYLANDYPSAVRDGKVVNIQEFAEMKEFANKIQQQVIATHLDSNKNISSLVNQLPVMVEAKSNTIDLKKVCNNVKNNIIESTESIHDSHRHVQIVSTPFAASLPPSLRPLPQFLPIVSADT